ncbi:MAG: hypothetical protein LUI87_19715 [Lachnospiraceae bacterium]|nr:hypothetical protein [Lachnospiraceae bacterium]
MEKEAKKYILPARFGQRRRLIMLVIFAVLVLAGSFFDLRTFGIGFSLIEEITLIPRILVYLIISILVTKLLMWLYRRSLRYRPLVEREDEML